MKTILWAIDPFQKDLSLIRVAALAIQDFLQGVPDATVIPVHCFRVMESQERDVGASLLNEVREAAEERLAAVFKKVKISNFQPLKLIPQRLQAPLSEGVEKVLRFAQDQKADLIVVSTHARSGPARWFMGSFAETVLLTSKISVLAVNPHWKRTMRLKNILFSTDFSEESKTAFDQVLKVARALRTEVTIFHRLSFEMTPSLQLAVSSYPLYGDVYQRELECREKEAREWVEVAKKAGVKAHAKVEVKMMGSIADSVLKVAKKTPGLIAMASYGDQRPFSLLGSTPRNVVRGSPVPVWVIYSLFLVQFLFPRFSEGATHPKGPHGGSVLKGSTHSVEIRTNPKRKTIDVYVDRTEGQASQKIDLTFYDEGGKTKRTVELRAMPTQRPDDLPHYQGNLSPFAGSFFGMEIKIPLSKDSSEVIRADRLTP